MENTDNSEIASLVSADAFNAEALHPMAQKVADSAARLPQLEDSTVAQARALREARGNPFAPAAAELASIAELEIPTRAGSLSARIYKPHTRVEGLQPALVFYHGGGFVLGNVEQYDTLTQQLAMHSGCIVISIEYRLAPATKINGIHEDGFDAYRWLVENADSLGIDNSRIAVGGDSAGGNLTIAVVLACKRSGYAMPALQLLIYPSVDLAMSHASVEEFAAGFFLTRSGMSWFRSHYLESPGQAQEPDLVFLENDLSGLAPAHVITAGFDPLRDEGKAFAERLAEFGVRVEHVCYTDMIHGFVSFAGGIPAGMRAIEDMSRVLQRALAP